MTPARKGCVMTPRVCPQGLRRKGKARQPSAGLTTCVHLDSGAMHPVKALTLGLLGGLLWFVLGILAGYYLWA